MLYEALAICPAYALTGHHWLPGKDNPTLPQRQEEWHPHVIFCPYLQHTLNHVDTDK